VDFDVFISYASADKPIADAACATLEASGIRCWIAPRDIVPGTDYGAAIVAAIERAKLLVLIFSGNANTSEQIKREVERAVSNGIPIIPVRIENVTLSKTLEYFLSTPHWLDAFPPPHERYFGPLVRSIQLLLNTPAEADKSAVRRSTAPTAAGVDERALEYDFWIAIKQSADAKDFETFLKKFPHGIYESVARKRLEALRGRRTSEAVSRIEVIASFADMPSYRSIAIIALVLGLVGAIFSLFEMYWLWIPNYVYFVSANRAIYVIAMLVPFIWLMRKQSLLKQVSAFVALYAIETIFGAVNPSTLVPALAWYGLGMLLEWLAVAVLFLSLEDRTMMAIAAAVGVAQGFLGFALLAMTTNQLASFVVGPIDFCTTALCFAYGIRRQGKSPAQANAVARSDAA
jgi:hypothetical protein